MPWPAPDEFNEAIQNPVSNMTDEELRSGTLDCNALGLPVVSSGAFASVYRFRTPTKEFAVRCFLREISDRAARYEAISKFILNDSLPATVDFEFIERGILVRGRWYPILKMQWIEGQLLNHYVEQHIGEPAKLLRLSETFKKMVLSLAAEGLAHGDLQHGNILVCNDELRLVDYDGMFVPTLAGLESDELGHPNYQHPRRSKKDFDHSLDNFSSWIIYITLRCLALDPSLWKTLKGGDERLLLGRQDFAAPSESATLKHLMAHNDGAVRDSAEIITALLSLQPDSIPGLDKGQRLRKHFLTRIMQTLGLRTKSTLDSIRQKTRATAHEHVKAIAAPPIVKETPIPADVDWFAMTNSAQEILASKVSTEQLLQFLKANSPKDYTVAVRIAAIKCLHDEAQALALCTFFAERIHNLGPQHSYHLSYFQRSYETIFPNCVNSLRTRPWLLSNYMKILVSLIRHQCQTELVNFKSFFEIVFHNELFLNTVEDYLLISLHDSPNRRLRQELIPVILRLLDCYTEKRLSRSRVSGLKNRFRDELYFVMNERHVGRQVRRLAEKTVRQLEARQG